MNFTIITKGKNLKKDVNKVFLKIVEHYPEHKYYKDDAVEDIMYQLELSYLMEK